MSKVTRAFGKMSRGLSDHAPELLITGGIISLVGAVVTACIGTVKASDVLDEYRETSEDIKDAKEILDKGDTLPNYDYSDVKRDKIYAVRDLSIGLAKHYWPTVIFSAVSITAFCSAYGIMKKRYAGATAALLTVTEAFNKYRERVKKVVGEETERDIYLGRDKVDVAIGTGAYNSKGNEIVEEETQYHYDPNEIPPYAKFFDEACPNWEKDPEANMLFLRRQQDWANDKLHIKGLLTLNEVYNMLGIPQTLMGTEVGWVWGKGDEFVDFGLYDQNSERVRRFVNGEENVILLNFNCVPIKSFLAKS